MGARGWFYYKNKIIMKKKLIEIPTELFKKLSSSAKESGRSVNKEIVYLLKKQIKKTTWKLKF